MGDEPRRSGRATKGVNSKNRDSPEDTTPKPRGRPKKKELVEEETEIIRCVCGTDEGDEEGRMMICCDTCEVWQHNDCMGITEDPDNQPESYLCEQCNPKGHKTLLAAIKRGEKPWENTTRLKEENSKPKKGKKSKGGRPSAGKSASADPDPVNGAADGPGTPTPSESLKRKHEEDDAGPTRSTRRASAQVEVQETAPRKRKSDAGAAAPKKPVKAKEDQVNSIDDLQSTSRIAVANKLRDTFTDVIRSLSDRREYQIPDGHSAESLGEALAIQVEQAMYAAYSSTSNDMGGQYKGQFMTITANVPKNEKLLLRLLTDSITTEELVKMNSDDMASEELQQRNALEKEKAEKQHIISSNETGPRVRRTHKGEELVSDESHTVASEPTISAPPPPTRRDTGTGIDEFDPVGADRKDENGTHSPHDDTMQIDRDFSPPSAIERRASSTFDIQNVWSSVQSPTEAEHPRPMQQPPKRLSSGVIATEQTSVSASAASIKAEDAEIDRLLKDDDDDNSPPYSPTEYESQTVWQGEVDMPIAGTENSVARFKGLARHVAGSDLQGRARMDSIFPARIILHGRIDSLKADHYLCSLSSARHTDVTVHELIPAGGDYMREQFDKLYSYFESRKRFGVCGEEIHPPGVRDMYLVPVNAGVSTLPNFLQRLEHNSIESPRPRKLLLLVFVLRWSEQHLQQQASLRADSVISPVKTTAQTPVPTANSMMSPIGQPGAAYPPLPQHGQNPIHHFPSNPYAPAAPPVQAQYPAPPQVNAHELAKQILGPFYSSPTTQQLLASNQPLDANLLTRLKKMYHDNPATQRDFTLFAQQLAASNPQVG